LDRDLRQFGNQLLGHAVGEELLLRVARQIQEWQHGHRSNLAIGCRRWCSVDVYHPEPGKQPCDDCTKDPGDPAER
jgi:hypothetical protein